MRTYFKNSALSINIRKVMYSSYHLSTTAGSHFLMLFKVHYYCIHFVMKDDGEKRFSMVFAVRCGIFGGGGGHSSALEAFCD